MYWRIRSFPELEHLREEERKAALRKANVAGHEAWMIILSVVLGGFASGLLLRCVCEAFTTIPYSLGVISFFALWPFFGAAVYQVQLIRIRGGLRMYLEEAAKYGRLPMCLNCGYDLTGLAGERCPECGKALQSQTPRQT